MRKDSIKKKRKEQSDYERRARELSSLLAQGDGSPSQVVQWSEEVKQLQERVDRCRNTARKWEAQLQIALGQQRAREEHFMDEAGERVSQLICETWSRATLRALHDEFFGIKPKSAQRAQLNLTATTQQGQENRRHRAPLSIHSDTSSDNFIASLGNRRDDLRKAYETQDHNRVAYARQRAQHFAGQHPAGFETWDPNWNAEQFDLTHLREGMKRAHDIVECERLYYDGKREAQRRGLIAFRDQQSMFPELSDGDCETEEGEQVSRPPTHQIEGWMDTLPDALVDPHDHAVMDTMSAKDHEYELEREIEVWDSYSSRPGPRKRRKIDELNPAEKTTFTWNEEVRERIAQVWPS